MLRRYWRLANHNDALGGGVGHFHQIDTAVVHAELNVLGGAGLAAQHAAVHVEEDYLLALGTAHNNHVVDAVDVHIVHINIVDTLDSLEDGGHRVVGVNVADGVDGPSMAITLQCFGSFVVINPSICGVGEFYGSTDFACA